MNKRRTFIIVLLACVLSLVCAFAACTKKDPDNKDVEVTAVTLDKETVTLQLGATTTVTLVATVTPDDATDKTVTWTSSAEAVATVSGGVVTAVAPGSTTITATAGGKSDTCTVIVNPAEQPPHTHTAGTEWVSDATNHWNLCTAGDGEIMNLAAHADTNNDGKCDTCGYDLSALHTHTAGTEWVSDATNHWHVCTAGDGHKMDEAAHTEAIDAAVAPTCTEKGLTEGKHCSVCGTVLVAQEEVSATGHTEVIDAAVAPTCTEKGLTEGKHCSVCGTVIVAQEEVSATGHTEVIDAAVAPTCTVAGKTEGKHCSVCGTVLIAQEEVAATGHTYVYTDKGDGTHSITCKFGDLTETAEAHEDIDEDSKCDKCGYVIYIDGHSPALHKAKEATCTEVGYSADYYTCNDSECAGKYFSDKACTTEIDIATITIAATGHTEVIDAAVEPTCTVAGKTEGKHCSVCDTVIVAQEEVPATGHTYVYTDKGDGTHSVTCELGDLTETAEAHADTNNDGKCDKCGYQMSAPVPEGYTPNGVYTLDVSADVTGDIFTGTKGSNDGSWGTADPTTGDGKARFKLGTGDYLYVNMKLQAKKIITITGYARPSNSARVVKLHIGLDASSTGKISGVKADVEYSGAGAAIAETITVTEEGVIKLVLSRSTTATGCEITEFVVTISDPEPVPVTSVTVSEATAALKVGATKTLTATVLPEGADDPSVTWTSSDESVATVVNGVVTALKQGTATITVASVENPAIKSTCEVTVENIHVTGITLNSTSNTLAVGKSCTVVATVAPAEATIKDVVWTSSNQAVATVVNGVITATGVGEAIITVSSAEEGVDVKATFTLTVVAVDVPVADVTLNQTSVAKYVGDTLQLTATVAPGNALDKSVEWTTSNAVIATVDQNGLVTVVGEGTVTITVTSNNNPNATASCVIEATYQTFSVTFMSEGTNAGTDTVRKGETATRKALTKEGYALVGWYLTSDCTGESFDFSTPITEDVTLYAKWQKSQIKITYSQGNWESAAIEWEETNEAKAAVYYKLADAPESAYVAVDQELIRAKDSKTARVDVLGLQGNKDYTFKVVSSTLGESVVELPVKAYDRSGYAHFGYTNGVGAYKDDGTLKDNAVVIYVTNENKDTVMTEIAEKYDSVTMFDIPYCADSEVTTQWNKQATGIGWWLNNSQYTASNAASSKNKTPSNTYDPVNGAKLGFRGVNAPVVVRIIGTVDTPEGCTAYDSVGEGGSVGDNGNMARMRNVKNITIEGVGEDAQIHGWGIHFMRGTDAVGDEGTSFEVRNITFSEYTEDALGMEGQQGGGLITASVERCWIHHNTFLPGHCTNPAESDKAEGDGSCDFKRGMYYTCAYNWFEYCHKTNLVGSSDDSLQYNLTFHHNTWWQCSSRIPLTRQANVHFYNNYVFGDPAEKSNSKYPWVSVSLSYVHSLRANCYIFSEGNYYDGCKNVAQDKGASAKGWNNIYLACDGENSIQDVTSREQAISGSNSCAYNGTNFGTFDTDPTLFYYDSATKTSDCYLTDPVTARQECLKYSGVLKHDYDAVDTSMTKERASKPLTVPTAGLTIDLSRATSAGSEVDGVKFVNGKYGSGQVKGKDVIAVFTVVENTEVNIQGTAIEIANVNGQVLGHESFSGNVDAGTYFIRSNIKAKEGVITAMSFKTGISNEERIAKTIALIDAIGTVENTAACKARIEAAQASYDALSADLQSQVTNAATLDQAVNTYNGLIANEVIAKINAIGTVNESSGVAISEARTAYDALTKAQQALVTNYSTLTAAEATYENYKVVGLNNDIAALADVSSATTEQAMRDLLAQYEAIQARYEALTATQQAGVTDYAKVTNGIATLNANIKPYAVKAAIAALPEAANVTLTDSAAITAARKDYDSLTEAQKAIVGDITRLTAAEEMLTKLASQSKVAIFSKNSPELASDAGFTVGGKIGYKGTSQTFEYNGTTYDSPLKMQSGTTVTFSTAVAMKIQIKLHEGKSQVIAVDGTKYTATAGVVEYELAAGSHTIEKGDGEAWLCYVVLSPVV